jgi:hypothetical protein
MVESRSTEQVGLFRAERRGGIRAGRAEHGHELSQKRREADKAEDRRQRPRIPPGRHTAVGRADARLRMRPRRRAARRQRAGRPPQRGPAARCRCGARRARGARRTRACAVRPCRRSSRRQSAPWTRAWATIPRSRRQVLWPRVSIGCAFSSPTRVTNRCTRSALPRSTVPNSTPGGNPSTSSE